jgi:hypothetical protein
VLTALLLVGSLVPLAAMVAVLFAAARRRTVARVPVRRD